MIPVRSALGAAPLLALLGACTTTAGLSPDDLDYIESRDAYAALYTDYLENGRLTDPDLLQTSGTAAFDGAAGMSLITSSETTQLFGDSHVDVDFNTDRFSGWMGNFARSTDGGPATPYAGRLLMTGGTLDDARGYVLQSNLDGTLVAGASVLTVDGTLLGNFYEGTAPGVGDAIVADLASGSVVTYDGSVYVVRLPGDTGLPRVTLSAIMERD